MIIHNSEEAIELFAMGTLYGTELVVFEEHLLQCDACQDAVRDMDMFLDTLRCATDEAQESERPEPGTLSIVKFKGSYLLVTTLLPNTNRENIGVLVRDPNSDRLYCRFRRDFEEFAGGHAARLQQLPDMVSQIASEVGAGRCLEWMESTLSNTVRISARKSVVVEDCTKTLDRLYGRYIHPTVLPFRTHLPLYSLEAAAGKFGRQMAIEAEGWVEIRAAISLSDDMFVTHVIGHSMEPTIPDASLCAFRSKIAEPWDGKVLLVEQYGESGGNRYTVKRCHISKDVDSVHQGDEAWLHQGVTLESINPAYESWDVASAGKIRPLGEFLCVV